MKKLIVPAAVAAVLAISGFARAITVEQASNIPGNLLISSPSAGSGNNVNASFDIDITNGGITITPTSVGPYDGSDDTAIDVFNNSSSTVPFITVSSTLDIDGFDGDGIGTFIAEPTGPTGYEGPGVSYTNVIGETFNGVDGTGQTLPIESVQVNFTGGLGAGGTAYFLLEENLAAAGLPAPVITNGTPLPSSALMGLVGIVGLGLLKKFAPKFA